MALFKNRFYRTSKLLRKSLWLTRNCRTWSRSNYQQICHKEVEHNKKKYFFSGILSTNVYVIKHVSLKVWLQIEVWTVACKQFSGTFTFPRSGSFKRFVILTSVNKVSTAIITFEVAGLSKYWNTISFGKTHMFF